MFYTGSVFARALVPRSFQARWPYFALRPCPTS
nr:MAG TPA: hypothetical protein [Crassvirales sp.]